ncbi:LysR substrate-binding domain-containing protein [Burkholderia cenocepacia]|uniref:LysR substrate-binding domain-containing protein n=1 Tax=Burkholderia cenocepacia TaxID=95486 RepID=UPI00406C8CA8
MWGYRKLRFVIVAPLDSPFAQLESAPFSDCLESPFISLQTGKALHTFFSTQARALGLALDVRVQVSDYPSILLMVAAGAGISIVPASAVIGAPRSEVAVIELDEAWARRQHRVCVRTSAVARNASLKQLVDVLCRP